MSQTILSVVLEVDPASVGRLSKLVEELRAYEDIQLPGHTERYVHLKESVPSRGGSAITDCQNPAVAGRA